MRIAILIIGMSGAAWFAAPLLVSGSINIGNATGIIFFLAMFLYGIGMEEMNPFLVRMWKSKWGKAVYATLFGVVLSVFVLVLSASVFMYKATQQRPVSKTTVIVLGCRVYGEQPSLMLKERLDAAYEYLVTNPGAVCILSGGQGQGENISEAECMYRYLLGRGISSDRLMKEDKSTSTRENLAFSKTIIEEQGLCGNIAIVTNEFHQYRAGEIAKDLGMNHGAVNGKTAWWLFPTYYVRELYGIVYEWIF